MMTCPALRNEIKKMEQQCDEIIANSKADIPEVNA